MNRNDRALLLGMLIGDGCLKTRKHIKDNGEQSIYYEYVLCHSTKQEDYLKVKLELFHSIMGGKKPIIHYENPILSNGKIYNSCRFSRCHRIFRILHKYLYSNNNKKHITRKILNFLTPQAIAIWYMDDGGLSKSKLDGNIISASSRIYTYCSEEEADVISSYFKEEWNIECYKSKYGQKDQWNIRFSVKETRKFESLIKDFIIPSMQYKLISNWIPRAPDISIGNDDMV